MPGEFCPNCHAELPPRARACPECGADEQTGWSEDAQRDALGIPDDSFDYNEFVEREFHGKEPKRRRQIFWAAIAIVLLILLLLGWLA